MSLTGLQLWVYGLDVRKATWQIVDCTKGIPFGSGDEEKIDDITSECGAVKTADYIDLTLHRGCVAKKRDQSHEDTWETMGLSLDRKQADIFLIERRAPCQVPFPSQVQTVLNDQHRCQHLSSSGG